MNPLLPLEIFFVASGLVLAVAAVVIAADSTHPRRWGASAFWFLLAVAMGAGRWLPETIVGAIVIALAVLAATRRADAPPTASAQRAPQVDWLSVRRALTPILLVPAVAVLGGFTLNRVRGEGWQLVDARQLSLVALGLGCVVGLVAALRATRASPRAVATAGTGLLQTIGWTLLLPQLLAALGGILGRAGVGDAIAQVVAAVLPVDHAAVAVVAYCAGMAAFTILLGNAFAAFPVITLGIGLPFVVRAHGGDPAIMGALGMLSGYCGTLVTPMAANFNLVPVRLLELRSDWSVIRVQAPFALAIWIFNVALMLAFVYR